MIKIPAIAARILGKIWCKVQNVHCFSTYNYFRGCKNDMVVKVKHHQISTSSTLRLTQYISKGFIGIFIAYNPQLRSSPAALPLSFGGGGWPALSPRQEWRSAGKRYIIIDYDDPLCYIAFLLPYYILILQGVTYKKYKIEILPTTAPSQFAFFPTESSTHSISHSTFLATLAFHVTNSCGLCLGKKNV